MSNTKKGVRVVNDYAVYDRLPPVLREVVRRAPYDLATKKWTKAYPTRAALIAAIVAFVARDTLKTYGSDHPQAARCDAPRAPEWERPKPRKGRRDAARG